MLIHKFSIHTSHFWRWPCFCKTTGFQAVRSTWHFQALLFISFRSVVLKRNFNIFLVLSFSQDFWLYHHSCITSNCIFIICRHCKIFNTLVPILCGISQMAMLSLMCIAPPPLSVTGLQSLSLSRVHWNGQTLYVVAPPQLWFLEFINGCVTTYNPFSATGSFDPDRMTATHVGSLPSMQSSIAYLETHFGVRRATIDFFTFKNSWISVYMP